MRQFLLDSDYIQDLIDDFFEIFTPTDLEDARNIYVGFDATLYAGPSKTEENYMRFRDYLTYREEK